MEIEWLLTFPQITHFSLYSVGSTPTLLVDVGCDDWGEVIKSHMGHQLSYLGSPPAISFVMIVAYLNFETGFGEGLREKEAKRKISISFLSTTSR